MRVGCVQTEPVFGNVKRNVDRASKMIRGASADLLVLPELFSTGYLFPNRRSLASIAEPVPNGNTCRRMIELARECNSVVVFGIAESDSGRIFNSAVCVTADGHVGTYRKLHLFGPEKGYFDPGDQPPDVWNIGICKLGMMVCFDWAFPEVCRILALKGAQVVCHPSNFITQFPQSVMRARSVENGVFTITTNRTGRETNQTSSLEFTGRSQITDVRGNVLSLADGTTEAVITCEIDPSRADDKMLTEVNDLISDRRPEFYKDIISG